MKNDRLSTLRRALDRINLDGYIVPKNDEFFGEYVSKSNDRLKYISSFSGSAGCALIFKKKAYLFIDGRYSIQAKKEADKNFKIIEVHKTKPFELLKKNSKKLNIGFDPKLHSEVGLLNSFKTQNVQLVSIKKNLIDKIWSNKPKKKYHKFFTLKSKHVGLDYKDKINIVCNILRKKKLNNLLITAPENLAWILNIRGKDSDYSPLPNCNAIINKKKKITLIVDKNKISKKFKLFFGNILNYINPSDVTEYLKNLDHKESFLIDKFTCSLFYKKEIKKKFTYLEEIDPIFFFKSKKKIMWK